MEDVKWISVRNFPNYLVNENGDVVRKKNGKSKTATISDRGYAVMNIYDTPSREWKSKKLSRIVWESFNGCGCPEVIDHIDGNKLNNKLSNLQCITHKENISKDKTRHPEQKNKYELNDEKKKLIISNFRLGIWSSTDIKNIYGIPTNYFFSVVSRGTWDKLLDDEDTLQ